MAKNDRALTRLWTGRYGEWLEAQFQMKNAVRISNVIGNSGWKTLRTCTPAIDLETADDCEDGGAVVGTSTPIFARFRPIIC